MMLWWRHPDPTRNIPLSMANGGRLSVRVNPSDRHRCWPSAAATCRVLSALLCQPTELCPKSLYPLKVRRILDSGAMTSLSIKNTLYARCPRPLQLYWNRLETSDLGYRLAKGAFWLLAGTVLSRGLMLIASIFVARILGKDVFGELGIVRSSLDMFGVLAGFGLGLTATKHVAEYRKSNPDRAGRIIALSGVMAMGTGGLMALVLFVLAPWLAAHTLNAPHLSGVIRIGCLLLLLSAQTGAQTGTLAGFEAFKTIARVNLLVGLASFPILVAGAHFGGLKGALWGLTLNMTVHWTLNHLALRKATAREGIPFRLLGCARERSVLWKFSIPAALSGLSFSLANWGCGALLVNRPGGYGEMGILNAANQWRMVILFVSSIGVQIVLPVLSDLSGNDDRRKYLRVLKYSALFNGGTAIAIVIPIVLFSRSIMSSYGEGFGAGASVLVLLACSAALVSLTKVAGQAIISKGKMWIRFFSQAAWAVAVIVLAWYFVHIGSGAIGIALAHLIAYLLYGIWQYCYIMVILRKQTWTNDTLLA